MAEPCLTIIRKMYYLYVVVYVRGTYIYSIIYLMVVVPLVPAKQLYDY